MKAKVLDQEEIRLARDEMHYNFRFWLLESFVRINQWDMVEDVIGRLYDYRLDLTMHKPVLQAMYEAIEWFITPMYTSLTRNVQGLTKKPELKYYFDPVRQRPGQIRQATNSKILYEDLFHIFRCIGVNLAFNERLFQKVVIVVEKTFDDNPERAKHFAGDIFFPALSLVQFSNDQLSKHIWNILSRVESINRYSYYTKMLTDTYLTNVSMLQAMIET